MQGLKKAVLDHLKTTLTTRLDETKRSLESLKASSDGETKSTVGDKYETGRAMVQIELEKTANHLNQLTRQLQVINEIDVSRSSDTVDHGSLIKVNDKYYLLALSFGIVNIDKYTCYVISGASPIGKEMIGKKAGDQFTFRGMEHLIKEIR
jgi:transcription elongation GreA/GreB family factor